MQIARLHIAYWTDYAEVRGLSAGKLVERFPGLKVDDNQSSDAAALMDEADFYEILRFIYRHLKDELIGIKAGEFLTLKLLGLIYEISLKTQTIGEALHYLSSYLQTAFPIIKIETDINEETVRIELSIDNRDAHINRIVLENTLTIIRREISMMAAEKVDFEIRSPFYHAAYPPEWKQGESFSISFKQVMLRAAIRDRQNQQLDILLPKYLHLMESYKAGQGFANKVKLTMLSLSDPALPGIEKIAGTLFMTPRTLQRKLEDEECTFRELKDELKKEISLALLRNESYSIATIAYVLGYGEPAAFIHSFKKWFGSSPTQIRAAWLVGNKERGENISKTYNA
jgi:AraC-like DNA-binding protein